MSVINVKYKVFSTDWSIFKNLKKLSKYDLLSFDTETQSVYSKQERKTAIKLLKNKDIPVDEKSLILQISECSGLSFPSLVKVTHFIFGIKDNYSIIFISTDLSTELLIWNWLAKYNGKLLIHNTLFDLKLMYHRIKQFPKNYEDTQLLAKSLINHVNVWKSKTGLKELMGSYYSPEWSLIDDYEPKNLKDPKFLLYAATDGSATIKLWHEMQETISDSSV